MKADAVSYDGFDTYYFISIYLVPTVLLSISKDRGGGDTSRLDKPSLGLFFFFFFMLFI